MDSGNLAQKAVLPLLAELNKSGATGSLKLERAPLQKAVYFRDGQILFAASNDPKDQLASILVEEGKLGPDQMQIAQARVSAGNPLAKVLTELGYISQRELADAARLKVEKILTDLFGWKEGNYTFAEKSLPKGAIDLELSTPRLLFNSIRRMQDREWVLEELGSLDIVLAPDNELGRFITDTASDDPSGEVLRLVDGVKSVKQIGALSSLGEFEVCKILAAAHLLGALKEGEAVGMAVVAEREESDDELPLSLPGADAAPATISPPPAEEPEPFAHTIIDTKAKPFAEAESDLSVPPPSDAPPPPPPAIMSPNASNLLIDEPEAEAYGEPAAIRQPPRPRRMKGNGGGGGSMKKILIAVAGLIVVGGGGLAGYYFLWPMFAPSDAGTTTPPSSQTSTSPQGPPASTPGNTAGSGGPATSGQPAQGAPTTPTAPQQAQPGGGPVGPPTTAQKGQPQPPPGAPQNAPTPVAKGPATTPSPKSTPTPPTNAAQGPATPTTSTPRPPTTKPSPTSPPVQAPSKGPSLQKPAQQAPQTSPASPGGSSSQALMRTGKFPEAAAANLQRLRGTASEKFTIAVGVYCDSSNVARVYQNSGSSEQLIILPYNYKGRPCYRVFWGIFDTEAIAERNYSSVPSAIRASDSIPVPVSRLIR